MNSGIERVGYGEGVGDVKVLRHLLGFIFSVGPIVVVLVAGFRDHVAPCRRQAEDGEKQHHGDHGSRAAVLHRNYFPKLFFLKFFFSLIYDLGFDNWQIMFLTKLFGLHKLVRRFYEQENRLDSMSRGTKKTKGRK